MMNYLRQTVILLFAFTSIGRANISMGLVGEWLFSGDASDTSGHALHGTVHSAILVPDRFGAPASAYQFGASTASLINVPDTSLLNFNTQFSVSYWQRFEQPWSYHQESLVWKFDQANSRGWHFGVNQDDSAYGAGNYSIKFDVPNGGPSIPQAQETVSFPGLNYWHHIVGVYGGGTLELYLDGVRVDTITGGASLLSTSQDLVFGGSANPVSGAYVRELDDVRIYDRALSQSDVLELFAVPEPSSVFTSCLALSLITFSRRRK